MYGNVFILQAFLMFRVHSCLFLVPSDVSCPGVYFSRILAVSKIRGLFKFGRPHFLAVSCLINDPSANILNTHTYYIPFKFSDIAVSALISVPLIFHHIAALNFQK